MIAGVDHISSIMGPMGRFRIIASLYRGSRVRVRTSFPEFNFRLPTSGSWNLEVGSRHLEFNFQLPTSGSFSLKSEVGPEEASLDPYGDGWVAWSVAGLFVDGVCLRRWVALCCWMGSLVCLVTG